MASPATAGFDSQVTIMTSVPARSAWGSLETRYVTIGLAHRRSKVSPRDSAVVIPSDDRQLHGCPLH
jgi:hypothetical protein